MWISPSLCSFPGNKCGTKFQNLLVAVKVCVYVGREVFLFCKFLLKEKIELQSLARFLIYIKWGIEEMECFFTHQHLTHTKISFLIKQHQGILQSEFSFLAIANKTCYCLLFWGKLLLIGISTSSCLWTFLQKPSVKAWSITHQGSPALLCASPWEDPHLVSVQLKGGFMDCSTEIGQPGPGTACLSCLAF